MNPLYSASPSSRMPRSSMFKSAALALALALAAPVHAAMPAQPTLHVTTLDGKTFDLSAQRGKWVIVNYWATWCVPCIKEMPDISHFVSTHKNVTAIGLAYDDSDLADIKAFAAKHPVVYPIAQVSPDKPAKEAKRFIGPITPELLTAAIGG